MPNFSTQKLKHKSINYTNKMFYVYPPIFSEIGPQISKFLKIVNDPRNRKLP